MPVGRSVALKKRQADTKDRPIAGSALYFDGAFVRFCNPASDREAQSDASNLARPRFVGTVEALKNVRQIVGANTDSGISALCHGAIIAALQPDSNRSSR
jgi:hypothetical protein